MQLPKNWTPAVFSKHLRDFSLEELAHVLPETGIHALDLVVRPDGHVQPDQVERELPRCCELLAGWHRRGHAHDRHHRPD